MSEKLNTQSVMSIGDVVCIALNLPDDDGGLFRVIYADQVGICVVSLGADTYSEYCEAPVYQSNTIRGSWFYPWASVDSVQLVLDSNEYVAEFGGTVNA